MRKAIIVFIVILALVLPASASANSISLTGSFDLANPDEDFVFLYEFNFGALSDLLIQTYGYGGGTMADGSVVPAGGFDPNLALFAGTGPSAIFLGFNDDIDFLTGNLDSALDLNSATPGSYTLALSVFNNQPIAYQYGGGTLGDGFSGLINWDPIRTPNWALDIIITEVSSPIPEPGTLSLIAFGISALIGFKRKFRVWKLSKNERR